MIVCTVCILYENINKTKIQKELHMPPRVKEDNPAVKSNLEIKKPVEFCKKNCITQFIFHGS
jgi:hypothetical protein